MSDNKLALKEKEMFKLIEAYRGRIINATIDVERLIALIIVHYFVQNEEKQNQLLEAVIYQNNFSTNVRLINYLMKQQPNMFASTIDLSSNLQSVMEMRNMLAHQSAEINSDTVKTFDGSSIALFKLSPKGTVDTVLNTSVVNDHLLVIGQTVRKLASIASRLGAKVS